MLADLEKRAAHHRGPPSDAPQVGAAMGLRRIGGEENSGPARRPCNLTRCNGAPPNWRRRGAAQNGGENQGTGLQWGSAELAEKSFVPGDGVWTKPQLQWGSAELTEKRPTLTVSSFAGLLLQWGSAELAEKSALSCSVISMKRELQWGSAELAEKRGGPVWRHARVQRCNGAPPNWRRRAGTTLTVHALSPLQWGSAELAEKRTTRPGL